jgi:hypothetical protein
MLPYLDLCIHRVVFLFTPQDLISTLQPVQMQAKEAFGIHDAAYHIGRNELLTWLNDLLQAHNFIFCLQDHFG